MKSRRQGVTVPPPPPPGAGVPTTAANAVPPASSGVASPPPVSAARGNASARSSLNLGSLPPSGGGGVSRTAKVNASLTAYVDSLNKKAEVVKQMQKAGPLLVPLPPQGNRRIAATGSRESMFVAPAAPPSSAPAPFVRPLSLHSTGEEEKSAATRVPSVTRPAATPRTPSKPTAAPPSAPASARGSRDSAPGALTSDDLLAPGADDHLNSPRTRHAGLPRRAAPPPPERVDSTALAALTPWTLDPALLSPAPSAEGAAAADAPSQSAADQRTSLRPWYLNVSEARSASNVRTRNRDLADALSATRGWDAQMRLIVSRDAAALGRREQADAAQLEHLHALDAQQSEVEALQLEALAALHSPTLRARAKRARMVSWARGDLERQSVSELACAQRLDSMLLRRAHRTALAQESLAQAWECLNFFGAHLAGANSTLVSSSNRAAELELHGLEQLVPAHLRKTTGATVVPLGSIGVHEAEPTPAEDEADFVFAPAFEGGCLRLPLSVAHTKGNEDSGIDHGTGLFDARLLRSASPSPGAVAGATASARDQRTANRTCLALRGHTILHSAAPSLAPSWVTLACQFAPVPLARAHHPRGHELWTHLLEQLEMLQSREHVIDLAQAALAAGAGAGTPSAIAGTATAHAPTRHKVPRDASPSADCDADVSSRLSVLMRQLESRGFGSDSLAVDPSVPALKSSLRPLLLLLRDREAWHGRFYMEVHASTSVWFAGLVMLEEPLGEDGAAQHPPPRALSVLDVDLYSPTQLTLALRSDGSLFCCGRSRHQDCMDLSATAVLGLVLDLHTGSLAATRDGREHCVLFGAGAQSYSAAEQREQQGWIVSGKMRPCFGIMGPRIKLHAQRGQSQSYSGAAAERERQRIAMGLDAAGHALQSLSPSGSNPSLLSLPGAKPAPSPQRSRHALTAHSNLEADGTSEAAGTIFERPDAAAQNDSAATATSSARSSGGALTPAPAAVGATPTAAMSPLALHVSHNDGLVGWVVPKLSVNFGDYDFLYLPTGSHTGASAADGISGFNVGVGACLAMNTVAAPLNDPTQGSDSGLLNAFQAQRTARHKAHEAREAAAAAAARQKAAGGGGAHSGAAALSAIVSAASPPRAAAVASPSPAAVAQAMDAQILDYKQRQSAAALASVDALREQMLARPSAEELARELEEQRVAFTAAISDAGTRLQSFSHFPPHSLRVQQAVMRVQRLARRYIGFRARRALWHKLSKYVAKIQRCWRAYRARRNARFMAAVLPIQRVWRGFKARKVVKLLRKYGLSYSQANRAAIRIQSFCRMLLARRSVLVLACVVQQKVEQVRGLVIFVQRMFRRRIEKRQQMASKGMLASVLLFQARIRGIRLRRMLAAIDPSAARQLRSIATSVSLKRRRWAAACLLQRVWRGHAARRVVRAMHKARERDATRVQEAWRAFQLRQRIDRTFQTHDAAHLKAFFAALGYFPPSSQ